LIVKILLTLTDLYKGIGGGQTVYRKIIETSPDIDFYYFRINEPAAGHRPSNTHTLPLRSRRALRLQTPPPHVAYIKKALEEADAIARSVAGQSFDIVEMPDYLTYGSVLKDAFAHHGVTVGRFVLAMHGNISASIDLNWGSAGDKVFEIAQLEQAQFAAADGVYGISRRYIAQWQSRVARDVHYIDPAHFVFANSPKPWAGQDASNPALYCIGRSERRKGNDLFVELVRWLDAESFANAQHIGDADYSNGLSSTYQLESIAKARGIEIEHKPACTHDQLMALCATRAIIVLPVRYDTLNLVALEALFSGCPVAVSTRAGACDYLDEFHPHLPYLKMDFDNFYGAVPALRNLVENYDTHRNTLHAALTQHPPRPAEPLDMKAVYSAILDAPPGGHIVNHSGLAPLRPSQRKNGAALPTSHSSYSEDTISLKRRALHIIRHVPVTWKHLFRAVAHSPREFTIRKLRESGYFGDAHFSFVLLDSQWVPGRLRDIALRTERNKDVLKEKLGTLYYHASSPLFRCNFWSEIARIERLRGQDLMACAYELRILRLLGEDRLGILPRLAETLNAHGFTHEAEAAEALFAAPGEGQERVYALLKARFEQLRDYQEKPLVVRDDRRSGKAKVAVIVSLYKAEDKLKFFLTALAQQTLVRRGAVEIVLVDSGSPTNERAVFEAFHKQTPLSMVYARSRERETIQAAWNRGIKLARAPYLVFLGADETRYPEALEVLAEELDQNPDTDWVMANSLVTAVDEKGLFKNDIMAYDRSGAGKDHCYLETSFLSWVGGMYRKTIHERFGYYDEAFRGAGDTEFKNRILPHINVRFVDKMLGLFLNYPDGQTTASPMAEIEDSRAWYLYRTPAGVRYAFENRPVEDAEALLRLCLGYRKSYCRHISTDFEYAALLADYILTRNPDSALAKTLSPGLDEMLDHLRAIEFSDTMPSRPQAMGRLYRAWRAATRNRQSHRTALTALGGHEAQPQYKILNDNRFEQHSWLWKSI
jgi:glycosyltransferase involved in cell wall biosynthesis